VPVQAQNGKSATHINLEKGVCVGKSSDFCCRFEVMHSKKRSSAKSVGFQSAFPQVAVFQKATLSVSRMHNFNSHAEFGIFANAKAEAAASDSRTPAKTPQGTKQTT
jgi:hypothetical protein